MVQNQKKYCSDAAALQQCEALTLSFQLSRPFYMNDCLALKLVETLNHFISVYNIKGTILKFDCNTRKVGQVLVNRHEDDNKIKFGISSELHFLQVGCVFAVAMVGSC